MNIQNLSEYVEYVMCKLNRFYINYITIQKILVLQYIKMLYDNLLFEILCKTIF